MQVKDLMSADVVSVGPDQTTAEAARLLARYDVGALPVCGEDGSLRGMITDRDIVLRCVALEEDPARTPVRKVMTQGCAVVGPGDDVRSAARRMARCQVRRLPVVEGERVIGMVSLGDLSHSCEMEAADALSEISGAARSGQ